MIQTSVEIFGIKVLEPVTTVTDLLVSAICFFAYYRLQRYGAKEKTIFYFKYFFLTMGLATTFGGLIGHAFLYAFEFKWKTLGWVLSMFSVALMERVSIFRAKPLMRTAIGNIFAIVNIVELVTFLFITLNTLNFFFVEIHATYGLMVVVFSFELYIYLKTRDHSSWLILLAVMISALSAIVHLSKFSIHIWFNYLDLSHVIMAISAYVFYLGAISILPLNTNQKKMKSI